jgi:type I restriction enzyme, S subunit
MSDWKKKSLADLCTDISYGYTESAKQQKVGPKFLRITDIASGRLVWENVPYCPISKSDFQKYKLLPGDIVIARTGATTGANYTIKDSDPKDVVFASYLIRYKINPQIANSYYIGQLLRSPNWFDYVDAIAGGSAQPGANAKQLGSFEILLPPLPEQTAIASVLSSLDDKIDLLHRQNATLEKMAETLFRQWFVEEAKEEWVEGTLDDILSVKGGTTPSTSEPAYWNGNIHWTSPRDITNLKGIYLFDTERKITELGLAKIGSGVLPKGTLLMSSRAPVGVLAFCEVPVAINQGYIAILDNKGYTKEFIYLWLKTNIDIVHSFSNGSTFMEISKSAFKTLQIQIPPKQILNEFQILVKPLFEKIKSNQTQIRTLTALRDTLLPKLMSGEIRIKKMELI